MKFNLVHGRHEDLLILLHRLGEQGLCRLDVGYCVALFRIGKESTAGCRDGVAVPS